MHLSQVDSRIPWPGLARILSIVGVLKNREIGIPVCGICRLGMLSSSAQSLNTAFRCGKTTTRREFAARQSAAPHFSRRGAIALQLRRVENLESNILGHKNVLCRGDHLNSCSICDFYLFFMFYLVAFYHCYYSAICLCLRFGNHSLYYTVLLYHYCTTVPRYYYSSST